MELDRRLVAAARDVKVLTRLAWPVEAAERFLEREAAGRPELPEVVYPAGDSSAADAELAAVMAACDRQRPIEDFLFRTARSYRRVIGMLAEAGTRRFAERSREIYGHPGEPVSGGATTTAEAAAHLLESTAPFLDDGRLEESEYCVLAETVAETLRRHAATFGDENVEVVVDPTLSSKAAAGARRIRVRGGTCFSAADVPQLVHHELYVHTLTALNGRLQPSLTALGLGAPRTTRTQEGLALFAELITNSIDIHRLRRIAARAVAIDRALGGADFVETFRWFVEIGQTRREAFSSAQRVFRGADPRGGSAFTKDGVYFQGLVRVHRFLRDAARDGRVDEPVDLMAGRMRVDDVARLQPWFRSGEIAPPRFLPEWMRHRSRLVAFLVYSSFAAELHLDSLVEAGPAESSERG